jgi:WD40 repeat protein
MAWSPAKNVLLMANLDNNDEGQVTLWNMPVAGQSTSPSQFASHSFNNGGASILPVWSPNGTKIALANGGFDFGSETLFYTSNLSAPVPGIPDNSIHINNNFSGLEWLSNTALATLERGVTFTSLMLKIWNIQHSQSSPVVVTINQEPKLDFLTTPHNLLAVSSNGSAIAVGTATGIQVGQVKTTGKQAAWQALSPLLSLQNNAAATIGWSADGRFVAALSDTSASAGYLGIWDATQNYALARPALDLSVLASGPSCFAWGPASQKHLLAISGMDGQVALWNVGGNATPQRTLPGGIAGTVTALAWSADGQWLAASYNDAASSIVIWKV